MPAKTTRSIMITVLSAVIALTLMAGIVTGDALKAQSTKKVAERPTRIMNMYSIRGNAETVEYQAQNIVKVSACGREILQGADSMVQSEKVPRTIEQKVNRQKSLTQKAKAKEK